MGSKPSTINRSAKRRRFVSHSRSHRFEQPHRHATQCLPEIPGDPAGTSAGVVRQHVEPACGLERLFLRLARGPVMSSAMISSGCDPSVGWTVSVDSQTGCPGEAVDTHAGICNRC